MAKPVKNQAKKAKERVFHLEFITQMLTLATSGFGLVSALAWNAAIQQAVQEFIEPRIPGSGLLSRFIYALIITLLAVVITYQLSRLAARFSKPR